MQLLEFVVLNQVHIDRMMYFAERLCFCDEMRVKGKWNQQTENFVIHLPDKVTFIVTESHHFTDRAYKVCARQVSLLIGKPYYT